MPGAEYGQLPQLAGGDGVGWPFRPTIAFPQGLCFTCDLWRIDWQLAPRDNQHVGLTVVSCLLAFNPPLIFELR